MLRQEVHFQLLLREIYLEEEEEKGVRFNFPNVALRSSSLFLPTRYATKKPVTVISKNPAFSYFKILKAGIFC